MLVGNQQGDIPRGDNGGFHGRRQALHRAQVVKPRVELQGLQGLQCLGLGFRVAAFATGTGAGTEFTAGGASGSSGRRGRHRREDREREGPVLLYRATKYTFDTYTYNTYLNWWVAIQISN